jgi:drug/metabolite transporter (DMT)-like permease
VLVVLWLRHEPIALSRLDVMRIALLGLGGHFAYQVIFIYGMARSSPANASLLMATSPIFVAIYSHILSLERARPLAWIGIGLSFVGIVLLIGGGPQALHLEQAGMLGDLLILACATIWAAYTAFSKPMLARHSPVQLTALSMAIGTLPLLAVSVPQLQAQDWRSVPAGAWAALLFSGVLSLAVGYVAWYTSVQRVGNTRTAVYSNLTPVVAVLVSWLALGDELRPLQVAGALVVLTGLVLTRRGRSSQRLRGAVREPTAADDIELRGNI